MATTENGIYYPSDYNSTADIPSDMKKMAESIDNNVLEIQQEQIAQDKNIELLQLENTELKAENERLNNDINAISVTERAEGENITLNDTAEARFKSFGIGGNSWQETGDVTDEEGNVIGTMPSPNYKSDIQNVTGNANVSICNKNLIKVDRVGPSGSTYNEWNPTINNGIINCKGANNESYPQKGAYYNGYVCIYTTNYKPSTKYFISCKIDIISNQKNVDASYFSVLLGGYMQTNLMFNKETGRYEGYVTSPASLIGKYKDRRFLEIRLDGCELNISDILISEKEDTTHVEHQSQSFTFPLAEGQKLMLNDYLADDGIHHKRKQIVLTGGEDGWFWADTTRYALKIDNAKDGNGLCNQFKYNEYSTTVKIDNTFNVSNGYVGFYITNITSLTAFKNYLAEQYASGTPVVVEYDLAEEEIEPYTPEQQVAYNEIKKTAHSYGEQTHIFCTDETSPIFNVEARKDMNTVISNLESMIISNASEEV